MPTANERLQDRSIRHATFIERLKGQTVNKLIALLSRADDDLIDQIRRRAGVIADRGYDTGPVTTERLERLEKAIRDVTSAAYASLSDELRAELQEFVKYEAEWQTTLLQDTIAVDLGVSKPDLRSLFTIVTARPFQGKLLREWIDNLDATSAARVRDAVRIGLVEGETLDQIVRRVRGTRARGFKDGILDMNRRNAQAVIRTAINHTATVARQATYEDNADIIKSEQWVSTLDSRTTPVCQARDGETYPVGDGPRPPAHVGCRSVMVPVTRSFRELGLDIDEAPAGTRASLNGQVPDKTTYGEWLRRQPVEFQGEVLGVTKAKLFRDGKLSIDRFVNRRGNELTLEELRRRDPTAFDRAGLD